MIASYEHQLQLVHDLPRSATDDGREIAWGATEGVIGLVRSPRNQIEIFLPGAPLEGRSRRVRDALEHQRWFRAAGDELLANRILLPAAGHFEQVAAFLTTELIRNGAVDDVARAFAQTEPLIELAIEDLLLANEAFVGLCGEMLVLHALLRTVGDEQVDRVVSGWKGFRATARDFQLQDVGVEVKTTTGSASSHLFSGVHQLEVGHGVDGVDEVAYFLVSLGLEWPDEPIDQSNATSLPQLVDAVIRRLNEALGPSAAVIADELVARITQYGGPTKVGYDHRTMREGARFSRPFRVGFARGYDLADGAIRLLTTDDLRARPFIDTDSVRLRVNLPRQVRGDVNPVAGLSNCAEQILAGLDGWRC
jgi:hypothetical protein